jgi:polyphosphate glucokinase
MTSQLIGVDIGGSGIKAAVVDIAAGEATGRIREPTPQPATTDAVATTVARLVRRFPDVEGAVGITLPAVVADGVVRTAAHIDESWIGAHAAQVFAQNLDRPCIVCNDADAAGYAEAKFGAAREVDGLVLLVTIGTGVGTAVIYNGELIPNSELGHVIVNRHVADVWVSDSTRTDKNLPWKRWTRRLDAYLSHLHSVLWPELIVIGGGIVKHADRFLDRIDPGCEVRIAQLGNLAGMVGAAALAAGHVPALAAAEKE